MNRTRQKEHQLSPRNLKKAFLLLLLFLVLGFLWYNNKNKLEGENAFLSEGYVADGFDVNFTTVKMETKPSFSLVVPSMNNPCGNAVSSSVFSSIFAPVETRLFYTILYEKCHKKSFGSSKAPLVVDVGGNVGYFTIYAAKMGCRVIVLEPLEENIKMMEKSVKLNELHDLVTIKKLIIGSVPGEAKMFQNCNDTGFSTVDDSIGSELVKVDTLQNIVKEDVLLLKIDTEGFEDEIFKGMNGTEKNFNIENIICETKKNRDISVKSEFINEMQKSYNVVSYEEDYSMYTDGSNEAKKLVSTKIDPKKFGKQISYIVSKEDWIPWEDLWFRKI